MMEPALLQFKQVTRQFNAGDQQVTVLKQIDLTIHAGEMIAIVGASGSGKSTLMNILGCLDKPSSGIYQISGRATNELSADELAELRREHFGFIFQRYHLLKELTAVANVEMPAIYSGMNRLQRYQRAKMMLERLGLADKLNYKPTQLSGGQQQRVSIARALVNAGQVILADEPTGALDKQSGQEVLNILKELHEQGHTVVIVTHDMQVAALADRIIEISDGQIIDDRSNTPSTVVGNTAAAKGVTIARNSLRFWAFKDRFMDAFKMALLAMTAQRLRTFLTMLGIIIGIASVVSVVALGDGTRAKILTEIGSIGINTLEIFPGQGFGDEKAATIQTLRAPDVEALKQQPYVHSVTPTAASPMTLRYNNKVLSGMVYGVGEQFFAVRDYQLEQGIAFNAESIKNYGQDVVIDQKTKTQLFAGEDQIIGKIILLGKLPVRVIGVVAKKDNDIFTNNESLNVWLPYSTVMHRLLGQAYFSSITVRLKDNVNTQVAEQGATKVLQQLHGKKDFFIYNSDTLKAMVERTTGIMTLFVSLIAVIALFVGGIGVMNIMLVSVTERTREIGVRMAVGARTSDILQQFLIEAVLVCLLGGTVGVGFALLIGGIFNSLSLGFSMIYSLGSMIMAFICSTLIGMVFGFFPARRAALMDPIHALERE